MIKQSQITKTSLLHRACALILAVSTAGSPVIAQAQAPTIPGFYGTVPMPNAPAAGTLPILLPGGTLSGATVGPAVGNTLTVNQNAPQATIDWSKFNIAAGSVVIFNQKAPVVQADGSTKNVGQPQWVALNRIYDANPSLIFGNLQADGKVYLINRNGILFGPGSQTNVYSLIASNLNLTDANFKKGILRFTTADDPDHPSLPAFSSGAFVSNYGAITTDIGGSVFLVGPNVVNAGTISSPSGKISLIGSGLKADGTAGEVEAFELTVDAAGMDVTYGNLQVPGAAYNSESGKLITEGGGRIGMSGATVRNDGLIRAVTAFKKGGVVILAARDSVTTGPQSVIESPIDPSTETADPQFVFNHPEIRFQGLSTDGNLSPAPLSLIEHQGTIIAPSGNVTMTARDRIFLADDSSINVAGLWLDQPASTNLLEAQLNSVNLRDDYGQKNGTLLGQKINVDVLTGTNIGNIQNSYLTMQTNAQQRSTGGGTISFSDPTSQVTLDQLIIKQGAQLDFSGGGIRYATGTMATSWLISGNSLYNVGTAPEWVDYDRLADSQSKTYQRFGVSEQFNGLYFGGGSSVQGLAAGRVVGSDAGSVLFNARVAVLDGSLISKVTRGQNQSIVTPYAVKDSNATDYQNYELSVARGLEEPVGGSVTIGQVLPAAPSAATTDNEQNFVTNSIAIKPATTPLPAYFGINDDLNRQTTEISTALLNQAGLSSLNLFANTSINTDPGAKISLLPGGRYVARTRSIDFEGAIVAPGGSVEMTTRPDVSSYPTLVSKPGVNTLYQPLVETVYLAPGSSISTAGQEIDNSAAGMALHPVTATSHTAGGTITITERNEQGTSLTVGTSSEGNSVMVATGALLDVSGGWLIDTKGTIAGGNAGKLTLAGPTLSLAGTLRGYSLPGKTGGQIDLQAGEVLVAQRDLALADNLPIYAAVPDYLSGKLVLGENRLQDTGFSRINLTAINDLSFGDGAVLTPSLTKLPMPIAAIASQGTKAGNLVIPAGFDPTVADYLGPTSITLTAGKNIYESGPLHGGGDSINSIIAKIDLPSGTGVTVAPGGSITLNAPSIDIAGRIEAPGGTVTATAKYGSLVLETGGQILASGYNKPVTTTVAGQPAGSSPLPGGTVTLSSALDVVLEPGSRVDVSGSAPVERLVSGTDGKSVTVAVAGDPGTLKLSYAGNLTLDGEIDGMARMNGVQGGNLSVTATNDLKILEEDVNRYQRSGFDALTFTSTSGSIIFQENLDLTIGRSLTLDSVSIKGHPGSDVTVRAPWITLVNTPDSQKDPASGTSATGTGRLTLVADGFLDLQGSVRMDGFSDVTLQAGRDIRLSDLLYTKTNSFAGDLLVSGNLTLQAARVYPTTLADFTITSPGKATVLPGAASDPTPVYSAGGSLTIAAADGIEQRGTLEAPQGSITLDGGATGRVFLGAESSIITAGSVPVAYGSYDGSTWTTQVETHTDGTIRNFGPGVTSAPNNSINLKGNEVIVNQGAVLNVAGGGSVYSAFFQSGIPGTLNPLTLIDTTTNKIKIDPATNKPMFPRYVILPDDTVTLPGAAVYLDAAPEFGLKAGVYSLLPADQYALLPGALVIQDTGTQLAAGQQRLSTQGYQVVAGYKTVTDTSIGSQATEGYSIRSAVDVLKEGDFTVKSFTAGNGGNLTLAAATSAVMNGNLSAQPLRGFQGGVLTLSAKNVTAQNTAVQLPGDFTFDTPISTIADLPAGSLTVNTATVSNKGFAEVALGSKQYDSVNNIYTYASDTVTVKSGGTLQASSVILSANSAVTIESNGQVQATGDSNGGIATVDVPNGAFNLNANALIHASNGLRFNVGNMSLLGSFQADHSSLTLAANNIFFTETPPTDALGICLSKNRVDSLNGNYDDLTLISRGSMVFQENVDLNAKGSLTLDAGRYTAAANVTVSFNAGGKLTLLNSGSAANPTNITNGNSSLTFTGAGIDIAPRANGIVFDQFRTVTLNSSNDLTLQGAGSVTVAQDLNINAPRVTTSYYKYTADPLNLSDVSIPYTAADITIDASRGKASIAGNGGAAGTTGTPGGSLAILGASITVGDPSGKNATVLEAPSARVQLTAAGDIAILGNSSVLATGYKSPAPMQPGSYSYSPGGSISLESSSGKVALAAKSTLDVSASDQGDAGSIVLSAPSTGITVSGVIKGGAASGLGGSFTIDSATLAGAGGLDGLSTTLSKGGFNDAINIRSRSGDLALAAASTLTGRKVVVAADGGAIDLSGTINADTTDGGGRIELYSGKGKKLTLETGSTLTARGTAAGANGGTVELSSQDDPDNAKTFNGSYALNVNSRSTINVAGNGGTGGTVAFRAYQGYRQTGDATLNDVDMAPLAGTITGASQVSVEAVRSYTLTPVAGSSNLNIGAATGYLSDAAGFMTAAPGLGTRLFANSSNPALLRTGIELVSAAGVDMTLDQGWDLSNTRPGGAAGVLTLRAGGNLIINQNLIDAPNGTDFASLYNSTMKDSWGINLVAGADANAADYKAAVSGNSLAPVTGASLTIASGKVVYTEDAPITFAAGNNAVLSGWTGTTGPGYMINNQMQYNLGSYGGTVRGAVGNDLDLTNSGSAIQTALGDIDIRAGGNLNLGTNSNTGSIRTTGEYEKSQIETMPGSGQFTAAGTTSYWTYNGGGGISLDVGGAIAGNLNADNGWDGAYIDPSVAGNTKVLYPWYLAAGFGGSKENGVNSYIPVTVGVATMGGGDISVRAGGSLLTQIGAFGRSDQGNLHITTGGDMIGRFRIMNGTATVTSGGGFGKDDLGTTPTWQPVIEMAAARVIVAAQGDVNLGAVLNPDNSRDRIFFGNTNQKDWNMTYATDASTSISSLAGTVTFSGIDSFNAYNFTGSSTLLSSLLDRQKILPASFRLSSAGDLSIRNSFHLSPSTTGNLGLYAVGDITGAYTSSDTGGTAQPVQTASFSMLDVDVNSFYGRQADTGNQKSSQLVADPGSSDTAMRNVISHLNDHDPVTVMAGRNIDTIKLVLNKKAEITAGGDISKLDFVGQNDSTDSVTLVSAQGSIDQGILSTNLSGIRLGGPGTLLVEAGANINLGNSKGIESIGNSFNSAFIGNNTDSNLVVRAGAKQLMLPADAAGATSLAADFFTRLRVDGNDYSNFKAAGNTGAALLSIADARTAIEKYFDLPDATTGTGSITMVDSLIRSRKGDIYLMARGDVNVGRSNVSNSAQGLKDTGITTTFGGRLDIYSGGDVNVNESRTMTFMGGDIVVWSDQGNINAGRGSKTALSSGGSPQEIKDDNGVLIGLLYPAPSVGSGVRASTYDPDGSTGPRTAPAPGDIYIFAPKGIIDAGEAGIAGGKVTLGATQVLNVQNISFSAGSVGVPAAESPVSLGALGGNSNLTDSSKMIEQASTLGAAKEKTASQSAAVDDFMSRWLDLKIISFDGDFEAPALDGVSKQDREKLKRK